MKNAHSSTIKFLDVLNHHFGLALVSFFFVMTGRAVEPEILAILEFLAKKRSIVKNGLGLSFGVNY